MRQYMLPIAACLFLGGVILAVTIGRSRTTTDASTTEAPVDNSVAVTSPSAPITYRERTSTLGSAAADVQNREALEQEAKQQALAERQAFVARYTSERVDTTWAAAQESRLLTASKSAQISAMNADPVDLAMDCKSSMCRVQADFENMSKAQDWLTLFTLNAGEAMAATSFEYVQNPDGGARVIAYGAVKK